MKHKLSKPVKVLIEIVLLAALVVLFVIVLHPKELRGYLMKVTLDSILGLLVFQFAIHIVGACQWVVLLRQAGIKVSPWYVFWSRLSGCAITSLTPSAYFGGEPIRAAMLKNETMSYQNVFATIAVDKYIELFTKFPIAVLGFGCLIMLARPSTVLLVVSSVFVVFFFALFFLIMVKLFQGGDVHHEPLQDGPAPAHQVEAPSRREGHPRGAGFHRERVPHHQEQEGVLPRDVPGDPAQRRGALPVRVRPVRAGHLQRARRGHHLLRPRIPRDLQRDPRATSGRWKGSSCSCSASWGSDRTGA